MTTKKTQAQRKKESIARKKKRRDPIKSRIAKKAASKMTPSEKTKRAKLAWKTRRKRYGKQGR